jgi:hypothetical protein
LTPGNAHRALFLTPGVYPYTVDGVIKGEVLVLTGVPPVNASPGPSTTPGPTRHSWQGTVHATAHYQERPVPCSPYAYNCDNGFIRVGLLTDTGTYDGTLILAEDSDGLITGRGRVSASGCTKFPHPAKHISFEVRGVDDGKALSLQIIPSSYRPDGTECGFAFGWTVTPGASPSAAVIPITAPGTAQGPWQGRADLPERVPTTTLTAVFWFAFNCTDCRKSQ